jgi:4-diphosphocytidyl-2-C-methyl-D-erythritol kinase
VISLKGALPTNGKGHLMGKIELKAFAKINLSLDVIGRLDNGYHAIRSVMHAISLYDRVTVETGGAAGLYRNPSIKLSVNAGALLEQSGQADVICIPEDRQNTAWKAAMAMAERFCPVTGGRIQIKVEKRIPVAAGLAGGSADAAAVILALAKLWATGADLESLMRIGAGVGADVPFCMAAIAAKNENIGFQDAPLACSAALAEGIGDQLTPLPSFAAAKKAVAAKGESDSIQNSPQAPSTVPKEAIPAKDQIGILLLKPGIAVSTAQIYSLYDDFMCSKERMPRPDTDAFVSALWRSGLDLRDHEICKNMVNVLENITIKEYPVVNTLIESVRQHADSDHVLMSGSGPTVIAFFRGKNRASAAFRDFRHGLQLQPPISCESYLAHLI